MRKHGYIKHTWGGATAGGVLYSRDPLLRDPVDLIAEGGVGGLVVGAGPTAPPETTIEDWDEVRDLIALGVTALTPCPISSKANIKVKILII